MFHHAELSRSPFLPSLSLSGSWKALSSLATPTLGLAGSPMRDSRYFPIEIKGLLPQTAAVPITVFNKTKPLSGNCPSGTGRPSGVAAQALLPLLSHLGHTALLSALSLSRSLTLPGSSAWLALLHHSVLCLTVTLFPGHPPPWCGDTLLFSSLHSPHH